MNRIKELRTVKHLTQEELGHILNVQKAAISKYENGRAEPSVDVLKKLSALFGVSSDYILGISATDNPDASPAPSTAAAPPITPQDRELLRKYHELDQRGRQAVLDTIEREHSYTAPKAEDAGT